jgi:hypothetical protein
MLKCAFISYVGAGSWTVEEGEVSSETFRRKSGNLSPKEVSDLALDLAMVAGELQLAAEERFRKHCIKILSDDYGVPENEAEREARNVWWYITRTRLEERED